MGSRQKLILVGAIVAGLLAAIGLVGYVRNVKDSAYKGTEVIDVFKVEKTIPKGTSGDIALDGFIASGKSPKDHVPDGYLTDLDSIKSQVAVRSLPKDTLLLRSDFVSERNASSGVASLLESRGLVSVTVGLDETEGVASLLQPGDFVNVLSVATFRDPFYKTNPEDEEITISDLSPRSLEEIFAVAAANNLETPLPKALREQLNIPEGEGIPRVYEMSDAEKKVFEKDLREALDLTDEEAIPTFSSLSDEDKNKLSQGLEKKLENQSRPFITEAQKNQLIAWTTANQYIWISDQLSQRNAKYLYQKAEVLAVDKKIAPDLGSSASPSSGDDTAAPKSTFVTLAVAPKDVQIILNAQLGKSDANGIYLSLVPATYEPVPLPALDPSLQVSPGEDVFRLVPGKDVSDASYWWDNVVIDGSNVSVSSQGAAQASEEAPAETPAAPATPAAEELDAEDVEPTGDEQ